MGAIESIVLTWAAQGTPYLLSAPSWFVTAFLYRRNEALQKNIDLLRESAEKNIKDQYEKRLAEFGVSAATIERNSSVFSELRVSVADQSEAINHLVTSVAEMARDIQSNRTRWQDRGEAMQRSLDELRQKLDLLQDKIINRRGG